MRPSHHLRHANYCFFIFLIPCIFLIPRIFQTDMGISNYGVSPITVVPYTLGFLASAYFIWLASNNLSRHSHLQLVLRRSLRVVAILQLALLIIPDSSIDLIRYGHLIAGMSLFVAEFSLSSWLILRTKPLFLDWMLLIGQALTGISAFISLGHTLPYEPHSQLLFQAFFMLLCIRAARRIE
jgi:hypothetical protein